MTPKKKGIRIPHMFTLLLLIIAVCTILTYVIPAGQYETYVDENGVEMLVDGSYHRIEQTMIFLAISSTTRRRRGRGRSRGLCRNIWGFRRRSAATRRG